MTTKMIIIIFLLVGFTANSFAKRPPKPPEPVIADDVVCDGCVGTTDIAPEAVTREKLSTDIDNLLSTISQLQAQVNQLQASPHDRIEAYDGDNNLLGIPITLPDSIVSPNDHVFSVVGTFYNKSANVFVPLEYRTTLYSVPVDAFLPPLVNIYFESFDCTGQAYIASLTTLSATKDVLVSNNESNLTLYKTLDHAILEERAYTSQSFYHSNNGICNEGGQDAGNRSHVLLSPVEEIQNFLPYTLPVKGPLRLEYVGQ